VEIHPSARRHGVADEDIEHAMSNAMATDEVVVLRRVDAPQRVIHAMSMRDRYSRLLPGL
jgi:hypothetical protein